MPSIYSGFFRWNFLQLLIAGWWSDVKCFNSYTHLKGRNDQRNQVFSVASSCAVFLCNNPGSGSTSDQRTAHRAKLSPLILHWACSVPRSYYRRRAFQICSVNVSSPFRHWYEGVLLPLCWSVPALPVASLLIPVGSGWLSSSRVYSF